MPLEEAGLDSSILTDIKSSNPFFGKLKSGESEAQETAEVTDENQLELPPPPKLPPVGKAPSCPKITTNNEINSIRNYC